MDNKVKLVIGLLIYGEATAKYLPYFLSSLKLQSFQDFKIIAIDNSLEENNKSKKLFDNQEWFDVDIEWAGGNIGFSRAYNKMFRKAKELEAEYFLVLNQDTILEENLIDKLVEVMDNDAELGSVSPKILKWDFDRAKEKNGDPLSLIAKTNIIDSCGIILKSGLRFVDLGQGELDLGQYDNDSILGPSGACALFRMDALEKVSHNKLKVDDNDKLFEYKEYYDELMFMYKEDSDLAYRLFLKGYKSKVIGKAKMYHDRTAFGVGEGIINIIKARKFKSKKVKRWSFLNQHVILFKFWKLQSFKNKLVILLFELKSLIYILFFEWFLLKVYIEIWKVRKKVEIFKNN